MAVFNTSLTHESSIFRPVEGPVKAEDVRVPSYVPDTPEIRRDRASYYNAVERMDAQVGTWLAELRSAGLEGDTIVFYYSDNGGVLPRSKRYCTDEGLRCALVVSMPPKWAHLAPVSVGTEIVAPTSVVDLAPTLLSLVGLPVPETMQGTPFLGPLVGEPRRFAFGARNRMDERYDFVRAVTDGRFHYVRNYTPHRVFQHGAFEWLAKGYQSWEREDRAGRLNQVQARFFEGPRAFEELYDLEEDPDQVRDLAGDATFANRLAEMRRALDAHMVAINDNGFLPEGAPEEGYIQSRNAEAYPLARLMDVGATAARRDPARLEDLVELLDDPNAIVRHWAILGLRMLEGSGHGAHPRLAAIMVSDPLPQNRMVAAEAVAHLEPSREAVVILSDLLDDGSPPPVRLQAINALTFIGAQSIAALPAILRAAESEDEALRDAGRYLSAVLEGRYEPSHPVFDVEWYRRNQGDDL